MKRKKAAKQEKKKISAKVAKFCNHCGGALRFYQEEVSCLMCGRNGDHYCNNCLTAQNFTRRSA